MRLVQLRYLALLTSFIAAASGCSDKPKPALEHPLILVYQSPVDLRKLGSEYPPGFILGGGGIFSTFSSFTSQQPAVFQPLDSYLVRLDTDGTAHPLTPVQGSGVRDPEISWDARRIVFSMKLGNAGRWQVHEIDVDGKNLRKISQDERHNDFDPVYLPDGGIVFLSDRPRLLDPIFHEPSAQLHRMKSDGSEVVQLSVDPGGEFNPVVTEDGHLMFTQWNSHYKNFDLAPDELRPGVFLALDRFLVWKTALDGTSNAHPFFGDHLIDDFTGGLLYVREFADGSGDLVGALVDSRGTYGSGTLVRLDPSQNADRQKLEYLTPNVHLQADPTVAGRWRSPYPLRDGRILGVYAEGPLLESTYVPPAGPPGVIEGIDGRPRNIELRPVQAAPPHFKLYLLENGQKPRLLHEAKSHWIFSPVEIVARTPPKMIQGSARPELAYGLLNAVDVALRDRNAQDVRNGDEQPLPNSEQIAKIQIFTGDFVPRTLSGSNEPYRKVREKFLGEVPVEKDGSFAAIVPSNVPLFWRIAAADGTSLVEDPFFTQVRPGQIIGCNGCHSPHDGRPGRTTNLALTRPVNLTQQDVDKNKNGVVDLLEGRPNLASVN